MCDCVKKMEQGVIDSNPNIKNFSINIDLLTGRTLLPATYDGVVESGRYKGKPKQKETYFMLSKCPWCGEDYIK